MKKIIGILSLILLISCTSVFAQTTPAKKNTPPAKPKLTEKDILMCDKEWHVISVEEWAVVTKPPGEKNKNDMLKLTQDGKFDLILFGNKKSGTWTKAGQYIYFVDETSKEKFNYKVVSVEANKLKVDFRDPDETHSIFEMEVK